MKKNYFIRNTRLRQFMRRHTDNEQLIDTCIRVSGSLIGFSCNDETQFYKEDRQFMKKLKSFPNEKIDNNPIWLNHYHARIEGPKLIKLVKEDIRHMA